jgi:hypothetical protein
MGSGIFTAARNEAAMFATITPEGTQQLTKDQRSE